MPAEGCGPSVPVNFAGLSHDPGRSGEGQRTGQRGYRREAATGAATAGGDPAGQSRARRWPGEVTSFAWDAPVHLVTGESLLRQLEEWIAIILVRSRIQLSRVLLSGRARFVS